MMTSTFLSLGARTLGPKEIDGLLIHLITGRPLRSEPAQEKWFHNQPHIISITKTEY